MPSSRRSVERDRRLPVAPLLLVLVVLIVVSAVISLAIGSEPVSYTHLTLPTSDLV